MNDFDNEIRMAIAHAEEHFLKEYVLTMAVGSLRNNMIYCLGIALLETRQQLDVALSDERELQAIQKFQSSFGQLPACLIRVHVVDVSSDAVVARVHSEVKDVIDLPTPNSIAKVERRKINLGLKGASRLPSNSEAELSLRKALIQLAERGLAEYVVFAVVGSRKSNNIADYCIGIFSGEERLRLGLSKDGEVEPVSQFKRAYNANPTCVIRCHVTNVSVDEVVTRLMAHVKNAASIRSPETWALSLKSSEGGIQESLEKKPSGRSTKWKRKK